MIFDIEISEQADADLRGIFEYIAFELQSMQNAKGQLDRLEESIMGLEQMAERFRMYENEPWHSRGLQIMPVDNYGTIIGVEDAQATRLSLGNAVNDNISPRNPILASIFYRLGIIELFGTGVLRIKDAYAGSEEKPIFKIEESRICITLPVLHMPEKMTDENRVLSYLARYQEISRSDVEKKIGLSRSQSYELLTRLVKAGKIKRVGSGPASKYRLESGF